MSCAGMIAQLGVSQSDKVEVDLGRHILLNSIRAAKVKLNTPGNNVVIACDSKNYWRRDYFPYYKGKRKQERDASGIDWDGIFTAARTVKEELREFFPYRVIEVEGAEADDVIASLCHEYGNTVERIVIVADDRDFFQLHSYMNVTQYDPIRKKGFLTCPSPDQYKREHILRAGDDGIPNVLSDGDTFMIPGKRQKVLRETKMKELLSTNPESYEEPIKGNYIRNKTLIDLDLTPKPIQEAVLAEYNNQEGKKAKDLMNYFIEKRLKNHLSDIQDFR